MRGAVAASRVSRIQSYGYNDHFTQGQEIACIIHVGWFLYADQLILNYLLNHKCQNRSISILTLPNYLYNSALFNFNLELSNRT